MKDGGSSVIPVSYKGKFSGVITERDIVVDVLACAANPAIERASAVMKNHYPIIPNDTNVAKVARIMLKSSTHISVIEQNKKLIGLLTLEDLAVESLAGQRCVIYNALILWKN